MVLHAGPRHLRANCWHEKGLSSSQVANTTGVGSGRPKGKGTPKGGKAKGKGKSKGKGKGKKGTNAVEEEWWNDQWTPEWTEEWSTWEAEVTANAEEELTTVDLGDVCGLCENPEMDANGWIRMLLDSGCARTVFPSGATYGTRSTPKKRVLLKTAPR